MCLVGVALTGIEAGHIVIMLLGVCYLMFSEIYFENIGTPNQKYEILKEMPNNFPYFSLMIINRPTPSPSHKWRGVDSNNTHNISPN